MAPLAFLTPLSILAAGLAAFLFGWLWYSPFLFMDWWLEGMGVKKENIPDRHKNYKIKAMLYVFTVAVSMTAVLAVILEISQVATLTQAVSLSLFIALGIIGLKNFSEMVYTMPETYWSKKAQKRFFVDTGFYVCMFVIATLVMYYVGTYLGAHSVYFPPSAL